MRQMGRKGRNKAEVGKEEKEASLEQGAVEGNRGRKTEIGQWRMGTERAMRLRKKRLAEAWEK